MRTRPVALAALATLLLAACAATTRYRPKGEAIPYQGHFVTFPSGMRLVVYEMPHLDRFMFAVSYRAGSLDDPEGKEGLAHLVEHMAFRGAPGGPGTPRVWDRLQSAGFQFNAFTSPDETTYYEIGKGQELRSTLELEAARMKAPLAGVSEDDFAIERDVVVSEYRERFETHEFGAEFQLLREAVLPGHGYSRPIAGTPESLRRIRFEDVRRWFTDRYTPAHAVLVLVSPVQAQQAALMVRDAFREQAGDAAAPVQPVAHVPPGLPPDRADAPPLATRQAPVSQPRLWVGWAVPGSYSRSDLVQETAVATLRTLFLRKLGEWGSWEYVDEVGVGLEQMNGVAILYVIANLKEATGSGPERVLEAARSAAALIRYSDKEIGRNMSELRNAWMVGDYTEIEALNCLPMAAYLRSSGQPDFLAGRARDLIPPLTNHVSDFAARYLMRERSAAVLVVPDANGPVVAGGGGAGEQHDDLDEQEGALPPVDPARVAAVARAPGLDRAERRRLSNGMEAVLLKRGSIPVAEARALFRTDAEGTAETPLGLPGLAMSSIRGNWLRHRELSRVGTATLSSLTSDSLMHGVRGSSANLDVLLEGLGRWIRETKPDIVTWPRAHLRRLRERAAARPEGVAADLLARRLFPGHPYGAGPTVGEVEALGQFQADRWMERQLRPERATVVVVSSEPSSPELWAAIEGHLSRGSQGDPIPRGVLVAPSLPDRRTVALVPRPGATQAQIAVGVRQPPLPERDGPATEALDWLVRARLIQKLRVEEGVTYGLGVSTQDHLAASALVVRTAVDASAGAHALGRILGELGSLASEPMPAASVARARWQVARRFGQRFDTVDASAAALVRLARWGLPPDHYERMAASIVALDGARLRAAAGALALGREVAVVVGDEAVLLPQLQAAGFEVEVVRPEPATAER